MKRRKLLPLTCLPLLLGLGLVIAWLAFPAPAAAQPNQPEETLFWSEDFSAPFSPASYYITATPGSGVVMTDTFLLTENAGDERGRIFYLTPTLMDVFSATFSINLGTDGDGGGADGLAFHFCPVYDYAPDLGGTLDASCPGGYFVAFDTYPNYNSEVYLAHGNHTTRLVQASTIHLEDNAWHAAEVRLEAGVITVILDGATLINHYAIPNYTPFTGYFGFSAATGGEYNTQSVDTIQVTTGASGSLEGYVTDELTTLPIAGATVSSGWFHAQTDANGFFTLPLPVGTYTVTAASLHYVAESVANVEIVSGTVETLDFALAPQARLYGYVTSADTGAGLAATISTDNGASTTTNPADGYYELYLDPDSYVITATATNYLPQTASVTLSIGDELQQDFALWNAVAFDPSPLTITLTMGDNGTVPVTLTNNQTTAYEYEFIEIPETMVQAGEDVLVVAPDTTAATAMEAALTANGYTFLRVTAGVFESMPVADILAYQAVFWAGNTTSTYTDDLIEYLDNGGRLYISDNDLGFSNNASVFYQTYLQATYNGDNGGDGVVTGLDIMAGLNPDITADPYPDYFTVGAEGVEIFEFTSGSSAGVALERASYKAIYTSWDFQNILDQADETELVAQVMAYLSPGDVPWFAIEPISGTVPATSFINGTATFTATAAVGVTQPGDYNMTLRVDGDSWVEVSVTMTVLPSADMGLLNGTIVDRCTGEALEATVTITGGVPITQTSSDPDSGYYSAWLTAGTYQVAYTAADHLPYTATLSVTAGQTTTLDVELTPNGPCIAVDPASLAAEVCPNEVVTQPLEVCNLGSGAPLDWNLQAICEASIGSTASPWGPGGTRDRGNIFEATQDKVLSEIRVYLNFSAATDAYFVVYEGNAVTGAYTQIHQNQVFNLGPGEGWYSSGPINVLLEAGKFYYVGASWNGAANYYRSNEVTPISVPCMGTLHTGMPASLAGYPPAPTINNTYASGAFSPYYFTLVTGGDVPWLSLDPTSGSPAADTCQEITATFDSTGLDWGSYYTVFGIASNALNTPLLNVPVAMTVLQPVDVLDVAYSADELVVAFTPTVEGALPIDYLWDFGDGITSTEATPVHIYAASGTYAVTLWVTNGCGVDEYEVVLTVASYAEMGQLVGTVLDNCTAAGVGADITIIGGLPISETSSDPSTGAYGIWLLPGTFEVDVSAPGYLLYTTTVDIVIGQVTALDVNLVPDRACIAIDPQEFEVWVITGTEVYTHPTGLNLLNGGSQDLGFWIAEQEGGYITSTLAGYTPPILTTIPAASQAFTDAGLQAAPAPGADLPVAPARYAGINGLTFYGDRPAFDSDNPGLPVEGFDSTLVAPGAVLDCSGPFDSSTNNACFAPGGILDGIRLMNVDPVNTMVVLGAGVVGNPTPLAGPNTFPDDHDLTFYGGPVYAVGFELWSPMGAATFDIYIYGPGDVLIGQTSVAASTTGTFWGVSSDDVPITRIRTDDYGNSYGELFDNIAFGGSPGDVPWVWEEPISGTVPALSSANVEILFTALHTDTTPMPLGTYTATLQIVNNADEGTQTIPTTMHIVDQFIAPTAAFLHNAPLCLGETVVFTDTSDPGMPEVAEWLWDFGDGNTSTEQHPTHLYAGPGSYLVTLTITQAQTGLTSTVQQTVDVLVPMAAFDYLADLLTVTFTNTSTNADSYQWRFGDGITSTLEHPVHTYAAAGTYTITLWATGVCGVAEYEAALTVFVPVVANFVPLEITVKAGEVVTFTNLSTGSGPLAYTWDFGDGTPNSTETNPVHIYTVAGDYVVTLTVVGPYGDPDEVEGIVHVTPAFLRIYLPVLNRQH